jgi:hypothetical protein
LRCRKSKCISGNTKLLAVNSFNIKDLPTYPNRTPEIIKVSSKLNNKDYVIFNILGKRISQEIINKNSLNLSELKAGIYMLKVRVNLI